MSFVNRNDLVEALSSDASDQAFCITVLPGTSRGNQDLRGADGVNRPVEGLPADAIAIPNQESRRSVVWKRLHDLLRCPFCCGMFGHIEMHDPPTLMHRHNEDKKDMGPERRHGEEIHQHQLTGVVFQERFPGLRWACAPGYQAGDRALRDLDTQVLKFSVDPWRTPEWIDRRHLTHEEPDFGGSPRSARALGLGQLAPISFETSPLPVEHGIGANDHQRSPPVRPDIPQRDPEDAVRFPKAWSRRVSLQGRQLLTQGQILQSDDRYRELPKTIRNSSGLDPVRTSGSADASIAP